MELTKSDIKRAIQSEMSERGLGRGWKKFYTLRDGETGNRLCDFDLDSAGEVEVGQVIDVEATVPSRYGVTRQDWVEFWIGEDKIWARQRAINKDYLCEETLIFEK